MREPTQEQLIEWGRIHDFGDPMSLLNRIEFVATMVRADLCEFCKPEWHLMPMHGTAWGAEVQHAEDCPVTLELEL